MSRPAAGTPRRNNHRDSPRRGQSCRSESFCNSRRAARSTSSGALRSSHSRTVAASSLCIAGSSAPSPAPSPLPAPAAGSSAPPALPPGADRGAPPSRPARSCRSAAGPFRPVRRRYRWRPPRRDGAAGSPGSCASAGAGSCAQRAVRRCGVRRGGLFAGDRFIRGRFADPSTAVGGSSGGASFPAGCRRFFSVCPAGGRGRNFRSGNVRGRNILGRSIGGGNIGGRHFRSRDFRSWNFRSRDFRSRGFRSRGFRKGFPQRGPRRLIHPRRDRAPGRLPRRRSGGSTPGSRPPTVRRTASIGIRARSSPFASAGTGRRRAGTAGAAGPARKVRKPLPEAYFAGAPSIGAPKPYALLRTFR